jgi:SAM-dependent methyltransferase
MNSNTLPPNWFDGLVSPKTNQKLYFNGDCLLTSNQDEIFPVLDEIANLLVSDFSDETLQEELKAMASLPNFESGYFRNEFFDFVSQKVNSLTEKATSSPRKIIEIGGGDGQFARRFLEFDQTDVFICDIYEGFLKKAPLKIRKICCDARYPYFEDGGLDVAVFWVSLHHLSLVDQTKAIEVAVKSLKPGGLLVFFEPNTFFLPRHIILKTFMRKDVYFDDEEKPLNYLAINEILKPLKLEELSTDFIQPPYSFDFVKKLKNWPFYFFVVELLYRMDRHLSLPFAKILIGEDKNKFKALRKRSASYFLSFYRKLPQ